MWSTSHAAFHCFANLLSKTIFSLQNQVEQNITLLQSKNDEIKDVLGRMENREEVAIDDAVVATAPLYKQSVLSVLKFFFFSLFSLYIVDWPC